MLENSLENELLPALQQRKRLKNDGTSRTSNYSQQMTARSWVDPPLQATAQPHATGSKRTNREWKAAQR
jgi:hypothetical protein